ncbi:hypothetical protein [Acetobacterium wieringae]|uniref:hypothetical protein n=1 Tax=Acetobacterium wieringae TaxID=52694 RepID=UPI00315993FD
MQGFFLVHQNDEYEKFDVKCELHPEFSKTEVPKEQQELFIEVENTNNVIKSLQNTTDAIKTKYFSKLITLAQAGLVGETAQPALASKALEKLKEEIILIEGQRIKNDYMKKLGAKTILLCSAVFVLHLFLNAFSPTLPYTMYCITFIGALIGTWISFGARKFKLEFIQLSIIEEDMMTPMIRLIYIGLCSVIFLLFLNTQIIEINIGNLSTANIKDSTEIQAAIGILCGLVESKIGLNIYKKAVTILGEK